MVSYSRAAVDGSEAGLETLGISAPVEVCAELGVPELSQFHAGLALEPQQTADGHR